MRPSSLRSRVAAALILLLVGSALIIIPQSSAHADSVPVPVGGNLLSAENFQESSVQDSRWVALGSACLTAAAQGVAAPAGESNLSGCSSVVDSPTNLGSGSDGYLQLTDNTYNQSGNVVFNRAFPSSAGLVASFDEYQYYTNTNQSGIGPADGIGFFLSNGSYDLTQAGPAGGTLGYAASTWGVTGLPHGYLGVGLDVYGNFSNSSTGGNDCPTAGTGFAPDHVALRGPGDGMTGYCLLATQPYSGLQDAPAGNSPANLPASIQSNQPQHVTVEVSPTTSAQPDPTVTVWINGTQILQQTMSDPPPPTLKLGFSASTGGGKEVHLIRDVNVSTVNALGGINIVKTVDHSNATGTAATIFTEGDVIPYSFLVTNTGSDPLEDISVNDPQIANVSCPATTLTPANSFICTGRYGPLTAAQAASGSFTNTAEVTARDAESTSDTFTSSSTVTVPTYQSAQISLSKSVNGTGASLLPAGTQFVVDYAYPAGTYQPESKDADGNLNTYPAGSGSLSVTNGGTAVTTGRIPAGAEVTFSEQTPTSVADAGWGTPVFSANPVTVGNTGTTAVELTNPLTQYVPSLTLVKSVSPSTITQEGQSVTYSFAVKNTGNVALSSITVNETAFSGSGQLNTPTCPSSTLAAGASETCTANYEVTQADINAGTITNSATVSGTTPGPDAQTITSAVSSAQLSTLPASVQVNKVWIIKDSSGQTIGTYSLPSQPGDSGPSVPAGFVGSPTISRVSSANFGVAYGGFAVGQNSVVVGETGVGVPQGCNLTGSAVTAVNGNTVASGGALPFTNTGFPLTTSSTPNTVTVMDTVTCSQSLTLDARVSFGSASPTQWMLTGTGTTGSLPGPHGVTGSTGASASITPDASYSLSQSYIGSGVDNYVPDGSWSCQDSGGNPVSVSASQVTVAFGQAVTCTITYWTAQVSVLKTIEGTGLVPSQFTLTVTPPAGEGPPVSFAGASTVTSANTMDVHPGSSYGVAETSAVTGLPFLALGFQESTDGGQTWTNVSGTTFVPVAGTTVLYRFVNQAVNPMVLPLTGGMGTDVIAAVGLSAMVCAGFLVLVQLFRRRRRFRL